MNSFANDRSTQPIWQFDGTVICLLLSFQFATGCSNTTSTTRTAEPSDSTSISTNDANADTSAGASPRPIAGVKLASVVVVESCLTPSDCTGKVFRVLATTTTSRRLLVTSATASSMGIRSVLWKFDGQGVTCNNAGEKAFEPVCQKEAKSSVQIKVSARLVMTDAAPGLETPPLGSELSNTAPGGNSGKRVFAFLTNGSSGTQGNLSINENIGPFGGDYRCGQNASVANGAIGNPIIWFANLWDDNITLIQRMRVAGFSEQVVTDTDTPLMFLRPVYTVKLDQAGQNPSPALLFLASQPFMGGLANRQNEISMADGRPIVGDMNVWTARGCKGWTSSDGARFTGMQALISTLPSQDIPLIADPCESAGHLLCIGIEL